jgi:hypothetical protein
VSTLAGRFIIVLGGAGVENSLSDFTNPPITDLNI